MRRTWSDTPPVGAPPDRDSAVGAVPDRDSARSALQEHTESTPLRAVSRSGTAPTGGSRSGTAPTGAPQRRIPCVQGEARGEDAPPTGVPPAQHPNTPVGGASPRRSPSPSPAQSTEDSRGGESPKSILNALTIDVEDYFQVSAFEGIAPRETWDARPGRVEASMHRLLDLLAEHGVRTTCFTLGWIAERYPALVRRIVEDGHELASHGYDHRRVTELSEGAFREDLTRAKGLLEDTGGAPVRGYRAPSFSIDARTPWAWQALTATGHAYSSSVYPIRHDHYGMPGAPLGAHLPAGEGAAAELPVAALQAAGRTWPAAGGGYFRLLPYGVSRWSLRRINAGGRSAIFYLHPWELDPDQPRMPGIPAKTRFRHYVGLRRTEGRLKRLLRDFAWDRIDRIFPEVMA